MSEALLVGLGGFVGSVCRYQMSHLNRKVWPYGTFCANLLGSLLVGLSASRLVDARMRLILVAGGLGSLTTWGTMMAEATDAALKFSTRVTYIAATVAASLALVLLGRRI